MTFFLGVGCGFCVGGRAFGAVFVGGVVLGGIGGGRVFFSWWL